MTDHPLTETAAAELWDVHVPQLLNFHVWILGHRNGILSALRATYDAGREHERAQADPFHDTRPWQDCTHKDIRKGDLVERRGGTSLLVGVAHHQNEYDNWLAEDGWLLTCGDNWPLRRIPSATAENLNGDTND